MAPSAHPRTPYTITQAEGGAHIALAIVGALRATDANIPSWNPFARNDTQYRNIILIGQDADSELRFLANNEYFNPYGFATVAAVLDCQRLYDWLYPGEHKRGLGNLIKFCFPWIFDLKGLYLHNAGNDAYWELCVCMELLKRHASRLAPGSEARAAFLKLFDAVFIAVDVEAVSGDRKRLTELGIATLDSRNIHNIDDFRIDDHSISVEHIIIKDNVPEMIDGKRAWNIHRFGGTNYATDEFYEAFGTSKEI